MKISSVLKFFQTVKFIFNAILLHFMVQVLPADVQRRQQVLHGAVFLHAP